MQNTIYRISFENHVPLEDAQDSVALAVIGAEGLLGTHIHSKVHYESGYGYIDVVGEPLACRVVARIAVGFMLREFGYNSTKMSKPEKEYGCCDN